MIRAPLLLFAMLACLGTVGGCGSFSSISNGTGDNGNPSVPAGVDYAIAFGSLAPGSMLHGTGDPSESSGNSRFGPQMGYPVPLGVARWDTGVIDRGTSIVVESSEGDLSEVTATVFDGRGDATASPDQHPDSVATRIAFQIPYTLDNGEYTLKLKTPGGDLIARVTFELREPTYP